MGKVSDAVNAIAQPIVENEGLELVDVEFVKEGNDHFLRLFIDKEEEGIDLEDCETISNLLSEQLDTIDPIKDSYILEVSSPGIERPLKKLKDFDRFQGSLATIKTYAPIDGSKEFTGIILKRNEQEITIQIKDSEKSMEISFSSIAAAHLAIDF